MWGWSPPKASRRDVPQGPGLGKGQDQVGLHRKKVEARGAGGWEGSLGSQAQGALGSCGPDGTQPAPGWLRSLAAEGREGQEPETGAGLAH